jgi:hypothetical protein
MGLPHVHCAIRARQSPDHSPLNNAVAETERPRSLTLGPVAADLLRHTARKHVENARKRWRMV